MQKTKKFDFNILKTGEFEVVDNQTLPFKTKGSGNGLVLLRKKGTKDFFAFEKSQLDSPINDFLSFCAGEVHPMFYKLKYGDDFFKEAKEFHDDAELDRYLNEWSSKTYGEDFDTFKLLSEENFEFDLGENKLFPAIVLQEGSRRWEQYQDFLADKLPGNDNFLISSILKEHETAVFCLHSDGTLEFLKQYSNKLSYDILRGKGTIGNLIEISYGPINLLLDCGKELESDLSEESELEKRVLSKVYDGILISHYHLDHAGLIEKARSPIYMGKGCLEVLNSQAKHKGERKLENINCFEPNIEFSIKKGKFELKVKPILVDHSAYDSYMFLITAGERTLLYTGDFRANGRKSFPGMLENLPDKVDFLICEATNMLSNRRNVSERKIEEKAAEIMTKFKHVFVFQAGTNIDRLVSFYKASRKNKKVFLMDTYVAGITENLPNIPNVKTFKDVYTFWIIPRGGSNFVEKSKAAWEMRKYQKSLGYCEIGSPKNGRGVDLSNFTMLVRPSMMGFLKRVDDDKKSRFNTSIFENAVLFYSLWKGYKDKDDVKKFLDEMQSLGVEIVDLHTSGHADRQTIERLIQKVNPSVIEYVHYVPQRDENAAK